MSDRLTPGQRMELAWRAHLRTARSRRQVRRGSFDVGWHAGWDASFAAADVPALRAEVERLRTGSQIDLEAMGDLVSRTADERDAARAEVAALEGRIRGLADGVDPDWRREHEGLVTPADLRALLATPSETEDGR